MKARAVTAAFGIKAHSGWAALVGVGGPDGGVVVVDRRRIELVEEEWARQPYHAAEKREGGEARDLVTRGIEAARRIAVREMRAALERAREGGHDVTACAVLVADPMPDWSIEEILAVHVRMHRAEGVLFREALARAVTAAGLRLIAIPEKRLAEHAEIALGTSVAALQKQVATLGKSAGPPWGKDQKDAALAALVALKGRE